MSELFFLNLSLFLGFGVLTLFWIAHYTENLDAVLTLLAFGGVGAWIAFLGNLVRNRRKARLQLLLDRFLAQGSATLVAGSLLVALAACWLTHGSILMDATFDSARRRIVVTPASVPDGVVAELSLSPGADRTTLLWTGPGGRRYTIDADGLPLHTVTVGAGARLRVDIPAALLVRNVVLIHPSQIVTGTARKKESGFTLVVKSKGRELGRIPFTGQTVWVGCRNSVEIPTSLRETWRANLANSSEAARTLEAWQNPDAVGATATLDADQTLDVSLVRSDGTTWLSHDGIRIRSCLRAADFPQVVSLDLGDTP